jgi:predicted MFS family arabinose efflux permease
LTLLWRVTLPFLAGYYTSYVFRAVNAIVGPMIASEFGMSAAQLGLLSAMYFLPFGLFQIPLGLLLDRFGPRRVNGTLLLLAAAGGAVFAGAQSYEGLVLGRGLIGLGVSACLMASFQAFVLWHPPERTATMIAIAYSVGGLGAITASVPLDLALHHYSWREIFAALAAATLLVSAIFAFWVPERRAASSGSGWRRQLAGLAKIAADGAFWRVAIALGTSQCAAVSIFTLWITTWLRDVAGFDRAATALALAWVSLSLIAGYLFFGRMADRLARSGRPPLPLFVGGVAAAAMILAALALGVTRLAVPLWCAFVFCGTGATLAHSIATRRYPREMAGRVNTALNTFTFMGIFSGQWAVGAILSLWPPTAAGYDPRGYFWAFGALFLVQVAGLAWLWSGRRLFTASPAATASPSAAP